MVLPPAWVQCSTETGPVVDLNEQVGQIHAGQAVGDELSHLHGIVGDGLGAEPADHQFSVNHPDPVRLAQHPVEQAEGLRQLLLAGVQAVSSNGGDTDQGNHVGRRAGQRSGGIR